MYKQIVNPATGRKVNVNGKLGQKVLNNYYNQIGGGNAVITVTDTQTSEDITDKVEIKISPNQQSQVEAERVRVAQTREQAAEAQAREAEAEAERVRAQAQARAHAHAKAQAEAQARAQAQAQEAEAQAAQAQAAQAQAQAQEQENKLILRCIDCMNKACGPYEGKNSIALRELGRLISQQIVNAHPRDFDRIKYLKLCTYDIRDFDFREPQFMPRKALGTFKRIIKSLDNSGCKVRTDLKPLEQTIRNIVNIFPDLCKNAHQVQQQQQQQQGGKRKNNSKNNTKKRKPSRKNNRKRRASKNKRN